MTNVVARLELAEARELTDQIIDTGVVLRELIVRAWEEDAWLVLGYDSWDDYCAQELAELELPPRDERREIVATMREHGMSLRAIAAATGVGQTTIRRDLSGVPFPQENSTPEVEPEVIDAEPAPESRPPIKGRDGKSYPRPKPTPPAPPPPPRPQPMLTLYTHEGNPVAYPKPASKPTFNNTSGPGISWASWSWNPVTGCLHGCNYCYAREIANSNRAAATYPVGFTPLFHHERLDAPAGTTIPDKYRDDDHQPCGKGDCQICAYRRVFVCSMADLYGQWVPDEWIDQVHQSMLESPQWQYILLTKFPQRYNRVKLPPSAWVGTSVDEQKRVRIAENAFRKIDNVAVKWLSLEPLLEPLEFTDLSMFDWVVIGAQTETRQPDGEVESFAPPFEWVSRITEQAREAGCKVHHKPNLLGRTSSDSPGMKLLNEYPIPRRM